MACIRCGADGPDADHLDDAEAAEQWNMRDVPSGSADAPPTRSAKDYAIEHAEYMAESGEHVITAVVALGEIYQRLDDGEGPDPQDIQNAESNVSEMLSGLRSGIYEFRKRRDRAVGSADAPEAAEDFWIRQHTAARAAEFAMRRQVDLIERALEEFAMWLNESGLQHVAREMASRVVILPLPPGESAGAQKPNKPEPESAEAQVVAQPVDRAHLFDLGYALQVLETVRDLAPFPEGDAANGEIAAAITGLRYVIDRTKRGCTSAPSQPAAPAVAAPAQMLTQDEIAAILDDLKRDHGGDDFEPECPACTGYRKLAALALDKPSEDAYQTSRPGSGLPPAPCDCTGSAYESSQCRKSCTAAPENQPKCAACGTILDAQRWKCSNKECGAETLNYGTGRCMTCDAAGLHWSLYAIAGKTGSGE